MSLIAGIDPAMDELSRLPDWLGAGILSASVAAIAFIAKGFLEILVRKREVDRTRRSALVQLNSLLRSSKAAFDIQHKHVLRLCDLVERRTSDKSYTTHGYEEFLSRAHAAMTPEELEIHGIIRALSEHMFGQQIRPCSNGLKTTHSSSHRRAISSRGCSPRP